MAAQGVAVSEIEQLKGEIERLNRELDQASSEKVQSAQYGLVLLEEKENLQQRCEELEALYDNTKHELNITHEALAKFHSSHRETTASGIETEESLLHETAEMESSLTLHISELENEVKQLRHELDRVTAERDRMLQENSDMGKDKEDRSMECKKLRTELREIKFRETRLITDYSELEEENIALQKQVSSLKSSQVEFESLKHEIRRLHEEMELLNSQVEELAKLKQIAEKHMEEALESLQSEREAKYALKKELDQHINRESFYNISNLAYSIRALPDEQTLGSDGEDDMPDLKRIEASLSGSSGSELASPDGKQVDLFSEVHLNELRKLEKQLELLEKEKSSLTQNLRDNQVMVERSQGELQNFVARLAQLAAHVDSLQQLHLNIDKSTANNKTEEVASKLLGNYQQWFRLSFKEVEQLRHDLKELEKLSSCSDATLQLRTEITNLKNRLLDTERKHLDIEEDMELLRTFASEAGTSLEETQNNLQTVTEELAQLYHHVCTVNGQTPVRIVLEHEKHGMTPKSAPPLAEPSKIELLRRSLKTSLPIHDLESLNDTADMAKNVCTIVDQIKHLRAAIENTIELTKIKNHNASYETNKDDGNESELAELQEQVIRLKSLLSTKREQIATLRTVLKSNKNTAEVALTNLKSKYENERTIVSETMMKLRNELRLLKEDAATFSSKMPSKTRAQKLFEGAVLVDSQHEKVNHRLFSKEEIDGMPFEIGQLGKQTQLDLSEATSNGIQNCYDLSGGDLSFDFATTEVIETDIQIIDLDLVSNNFVINGSDPIELNNTNTLSKFDHLLMKPSSYVPSNLEGGNISHANFDSKTTITSPGLKLVDYSSSDENTTDKNELQLQKTKKRLLKERQSSNFSFFSGVTSSDSSESSNDGEGDLVGKGGLRIKRKRNRKLSRKIENNLGKGRTVQEIPCKSNCQNRCAETCTKSERHDIHEFYWGLGSYSRQRNWLLSCTEKVSIRRRRQSAATSRRQNTFKYFLNWNDRKVEVCQQFLLKTFDVSQMTLRYALSNAVEGCPKPDQRGKHEPHNKTSLEKKETVHNFIKKLPAVPSHYCRNQSTRKYLPLELRNVNFLYRLFVRNQEAQNINGVPSLKVFRDIFQKDFNLGFHVPKKDKCKICECRKDPLFQDTEASKEIFSEHLKMKEMCKDLFLTDQKKHVLDDTYLCASFDLQKVLNTPHGDNLLLYYSRKYACYNETVYESGTRNAYCFLWGECDGNRGCNEICTIIFKYLNIVDERGSVKHLLLYCDSCSGQNRNRAMLAMLHTFINKYSRNIETVKIVYLLPGHTYMPVDSVHASIERFIKRRIVWAPSDWDTLLTNSRVNPRPFDVIRMFHFELKNWKKIGNDVLHATKTKTSDGQLLKISQVKQATFQKGSSTFKINYTYDQSEGLSIQENNRPDRRQRLDNLAMPGTVYPQKLAISILKKRDLDILCKSNVIPQKHHQEYVDMKAKGNVRDALPQTDEEDENSL